MFRGEDIGIDRLLKVEAAKARSLKAVCEGFDPDFANAYLENALAESEAERYERHLSNCPHCRSAVAGLSLLENRAAYQRLPDREVETVSSTREGIRGLFLRPQWVLALAAAVVLAVLIPFVWTQRKNSTGSQTARLIEPADKVAVNGQRSTPNKSPNSASEAKKPSIASENGQRAGKAGDNKPTASGQVARTQRDTGTSSGSATTNGESAAGTPPPPPAAAPAQTESSSGGGNGSGAAARSDKDEAASKPARVREGAQQPSNESTRVAKASSPQNPALKKIDPKDAMSLPEGNKSASSTVLKPGVPGGDDKRINDKLATIKPQDSVAPKTKSSTDDSTTDSRRGIARAPRTSAPSDASNVVESLVSPAPSNAKASRSKIERKVDGRKFSLIDGVWTDRHYNAYKEMPSVTVVRDSAVYQSLISNEPSLKSFFSGFDPSEKVIVVYKKIVYRLVPADHSEGGR